ncbi:hypothetical protein MARSALSMR5_04312 (plasmid) [Marinobacter salarius]|uniref:Uncharacterized protein n=1 Tax=Marinobacter salarius TaxID=1420917 RepID=A0A1W6KG79_9GAMM|nr:hypothetical protein MARSALSMR5_04312 [Marinobacter salarius]
MSQVPRRNLEAIKTLRLSVLESDSGVDVFQYKGNLYCWHCLSAMEISDGRMYRCSANCNGQYTHISGHVIDKQLARFNQTNEKS